MTSQPLAQTATHRRPWNLGRWISEFVVIVAGVLAALAGNALWGHWQDQKAEVVYLNQLRSDFDENIVRLRAAIALEQSQHDAASTAYHAVSMQNVITFDSANAWMVERRGNAYSDPRLLTGTVTELISTGDIGLLHDAKLRQAVADYSTRIREDKEEFDRFVQGMQEPFKELAAAGFRKRGTIPSRDNYRASTEALVGRPGLEIATWLDALLTDNEIRTIYLKRMLETTENVRRLM